MLLFNVCIETNHLGLEGADQEVNKLSRGHKLRTSEIKIREVPSGKWRTLSECEAPCTTQGLFYKVSSITEALVG